MTDDLCHVCVCKCVCVSVRTDTVVQQSGDTVKKTFIIITNFCCT